MKTAMNKRLRGSVRGCVILLAGLALTLAGCGATEDDAMQLTDALPGVDVRPGWAPAAEPQVFDRENLYSLVNGQAESFFAYGFQAVAVRDYRDAEENELRIAIWQLATPADAFGLFTHYRSGTPVSVGNGGDSDPGRRLDFWQDRYFVRLFARPLALPARASEALPDAELAAFADAVSDALPEGGAVPALVAQLPQAWLLPRSPLFFHEELSIQDYLWLGGQNVLGLGPETDGVLARYEIEGTMAQLLLVAYPDAEGAEAGLTALESVAIDGLVTVEARGPLLGAVFGQVDTGVASALLADALVE